MGVVGNLWELQRSCGGCRKFAGVVGKLWGLREVVGFVGNLQGLYIVKPWRLQGSYEKTDKLISFCE